MVKALHCTFIDLFDDMGGGKDFLICKSKVFIQYPFECNDEAIPSFSKFEYPQS